MLQGHCTQSNIAHTTGAVIIIIIIIIIKAVCSAQDPSCSIVIKNAINSDVIRPVCRLNTIYDEDVLTDAKRAFQTRAAATGNSRSAVVGCVVGTNCSGTQTTLFNTNH